MLKSFMFYHVLNTIKGNLTLSYRICHPPPPPLLFFLHHPKTAQVIKLKLSDFKDTPLKHFLQVKSVR